MAYSIYPKRGGLHEQVYLFSCELKRRGYNVYILFHRHELIDENKLSRILPLYLSGIDPKLYTSLDVCDFIVMETVWPWIAAIPIQLLGRDFVLHLHSVESLSDFGHPLYKRAMIKFAEEVAYRSAKTIITVSLKEYSLLRAKYGEKVMYLPLAIDIEERKKYIDADKESLRKMLGIPLDKFVIAFVGGMSYGPNREAAEIIATQIAPKVYELSKGKTMFLLIGPDPPSEAKKLKYIKTTGYVKTVAPYIAASDVCIAPIYHGGGVKMKILDCMSLRKVVIATKKAVEGTLLKPWIHYIPAEKPDEFVNQIIELLTSNREEKNYDQIIMNGLDYVYKNHSLDNVISSFLELLN
jgi:glycosyltransferase involved in cell wall biosynthesis